jgi:hypothetical protein
MSKDVINVEGEDRIVREDTAKAYRGINWALASVGAFVLILAIVAAIFFFSGMSDGDFRTPAGASNTNANGGIR